MRLTLITVSLLFVNLAQADPDFDRLIALIKTNDVIEVKSFFEAHPKYAKINYGTALLFRPIFLARTPEMVQVLLENGAERPRPIVVDFIEAIRADNVVLVGEILDQQGKVIRDEDGDEVVVDVEVNCLGEKRRRAIFYATSPAMVMLLVERGALLTKSIGTNTVNDCAPYTDILGNNALHVLAENAYRLIQAYPGDQMDIMRRVEATARLIIRIDAAQNGPGNLILAHRNLAHKRAMDVFTGEFWDPEFIARLDRFDRTMRIPQAFFDEAPMRVATAPRVAVPPLALARPVIQMVQDQEPVIAELELPETFELEPLVRVPDQDPFNVDEAECLRNIEEAKAELLSLLARIFPNN